MALKHLALAAALLGVAIPSEAFDTRNESQMVMFYYAFPLDAHHKQRIPWVGLQIQGKRDYQSFNVDTRLFSFTEGGSAASSLVIVGAVAVGAAVMVGSRGNKASQEVAQQQAAQQAQQQQQQQQKPPAQQPCPQACP